VSPRNPIIKSAKTREAKRITSSNKVDLQKYITLGKVVLFLRIVEHRYTSENRK